MATTPRPTKTQLRQHALDRALTDAVVNRVANGITGDEMEDPKPEVLAQGITTVAEHFAEWLEGAEEPEPPKANLGLATTEELLRELDARGRFLYGQDQEQGRLLSAYTVDVSNRLTPEALAYRTVTG